MKLPCIRFSFMKPSLGDNATNFMLWEVNVICVKIDTVSCEKIRSFFKKRKAPSN